MASIPPLFFFLAVAVISSGGNNAYLASAASGGRMGGSHFSSSSSSSSSSGGSWPRYRYSYHRPSPTYRYPCHQSWYVVPTYYRNPAYEYPASGGNCGCSDGESVTIGLGAACTIMALLGGCFLLVVWSNKCSLLMVQVGLSGKVLSIQKELNMIAESADTSTVEGLKRMLTETTLLLQRHADHFTHGYSFVDYRWSEKDIQKCYNRRSLEERQKFDVESLVNVDNVMIRRISPAQKPNKQRKEYIVVTILMAIKGAQKVPIVNDIEDLKEALRNIQSISSKTTLAAEVLWSPQDDGDSIMEDELHRKYPLLKPF